MTAENTRIALCCNDPDNGMFTGHANFAEFTWPDGTAMSLDFLSTVVGTNRLKLRVGLVVCEYRCEQEWVGNWCWNEWTLGYAGAYRILVYLFKHRNASFEQHDIEGDSQHVYDCLQHDLKLAKELASSSASE